MGCCTPTCQKWSTFSFSLFFITLGVLTVIFWGDIFSIILKKELSVGNSRTAGYTMWKETPIPMYLEAYLWNWTNSEEVLKDWGKTKPQFEECGPYIYSEHHIREKVIFNDNNNTITYNTKRIWKFLPEMSAGSLLDNITTLNPIVATMGYILRDKHILIKRAVDFFLKEKRVDLVITKTVDEFLFKGYDDRLLDLVHKLNITGFDVPFDKFAWFYDRNGNADYDGVTNMFTGSDDIAKLGRIQTWNYKPAVTYYDGECGKVRGTSGELWYPPKNDSVIAVFAPDVCSTLDLEYKEDINWHGIEGKKYVGVEQVFDNGTLYPEMKCFIPEGVSLTSGVRNVSLCKFGAPAFVSYPHFYLADPSYRDAVVGMKPNQTEHEFYIALEPNTGLPLQVNAAIQVNLMLAPVVGIDMLKNVKTIFIPMMWFKQTAELTGKYCDQAKILLVLPSVGHYSGYGIIGLGALLLLIGAFVTFRNGWKGTSEEEQLLNQQSF